MAPEQLKDFKGAKAPADYYSFGCILHDLIEGTPRTPYVPQRVSGPYDFIVRKCTETDPAKRFKSIGALRATLSDELRRDASVNRGAATEEWAKELANIAGWASKVVDEFVRHLEDATPGNEIHVIAELREEHFDAFATHSADDWESLARAYCEWARSSFTFEFCDVIAGCLRRIYTDARSNVAVKANAAIAMAVIAADNDRWYCMRLVNPMTDGTITEPLAVRITMEMRANDLYAAFETCAERVFGWSRSDYHPRILAALDEHAAKSKT